MTRPIDRGSLAGFAVVAVSAVIYWLANRQFDAGRGDFFYLADAFLHGRTWLDVRLGPNDVIPARRAATTCRSRPFPAVALMPLVALVGSADRRPDRIRDQRRPRRRRASGCAGGCSAESVSSACPIASGSAVLFGFSTQILWVTTRGGVWHTGHLIATILTFACLIELWGRSAPGSSGCWPGRRS